MRAAKERGLWCHMGRVNSLRRLRLAVLDGYDSVDGTFLAYGPDVNLPRLLAFLRLAGQPTLFRPSELQAGELPIPRMTGGLGL